MLDSMSSPLHAGLHDDPLLAMTAVYLLPK